MARIDEILAKGPALTALDIDALQTELALMPLDEAHQQEPWIWEAVGLIVNDPDYRGDAKIP